MISLIGKLTNGLIGWALPGLSAAKFYAVALVFVVGMAASWAYFAGSEGRAAAVARCESACSIKLAEKETAYQTAISDILQEVQEGEEPAPQTRADLDAACNRSSMCRENN